MHRRDKQPVEPTAEDAQRWTLTLTLAVLGMHVAHLAIGSLAAKLAAAAIAVVAWWFPRFLRSPVVWGCLAMMLCVLIYRRPDVANHTYLQAYAALAVTLCLLLPRAERDAALAINGRALLAAVMLFAVAQKSLSKEFWDGSFLCYVALTGGFSQASGGALYPTAVTETLRENSAKEAAFKPTSDELPTASVELKNPYGPRLQTVAVGMAILTLVYESVLAVGFSLRPAAPWPHLLLMAFGGTLLVFRPEAMFVATLMSLGSWTVSTIRPRIMKAYCVLGAITLALYLVGVTEALRSGH